MTEGGQKRWLASHKETKAASFIDILSPVSGVLSGPGGMPHGKLYRGVGNAAYALLPAAFRPKAKLYQRPHFSRGPSQKIGWQISLELQTLIAFMQAADRQGHRIPEDTQNLRLELNLIEELLHDDEHKIKEWPPYSLLSLMALAQHYGVPTRMLDWSRDPYVAAYFAAKSAAENLIEADGDLAVWAIAANLFEVNEILLRAKAQVRKRPIEYVSVPWADNANAKAQKAVFLVYRQFDIDPKDDFEIKSYADLLAGNLDDGLRSSPILYRLTLPRSEAPELLRLLAFHGYDGATMFPGLEGAVRCIAERFLWPETIGPDPRSSISLVKWNKMIGG